MTPMVMLLPISLLFPMESEMDEKPQEPLGLPSLEGFVIDPLESAITNAAQIASEADGMTLMILQRYLQSLCALHLEKLGGSGGDVLGEIGSQEGLKETYGLSRRGT